MSMHKYFRRRRWDRERALEIEAHLQNEIDENITAGMAPEEARRRAYLKFGNPTRVREEIWRMNSVAILENLSRDVRYAWRTLLRNPGYALIAVLTLGLGIGANTAIFTVINGVLLHPLPYAQASQIVHLDELAARMGPDPIGLSVQEYLDYRNQSHFFTGIAEYHSMLFTLLGTRWRLAAFWLALALHTLIFVSMGLFSFSLVMVAVGALIATPDVGVLGRSPQPWPTKHPATHNESISAEAGQAEGA